MKYLYYNPIELPEKVRLVSNTFGIEQEYEVGPANGFPVYMSELFALAQTQSFDEVQVYLTPHNGAYCKKRKKDFIGTRLSGWISLKDYKDAGGYIEDIYLVELKDK